MLLDVNNNKWNNLQSLAISQSVVICFLSFWVVHQKGFKKSYQMTINYTCFSILTKHFNQPIILRTIGKIKYYSNQYTFLKVLPLITAFNIFVNLGAGDLAYSTYEKCLLCVT